MRFEVTLGQQKESQMPETQLKSQHAHIANDVVLDTTSTNTKNFIKMFNGKKILLIVVDASCSEEQIANALGSLAVKEIIAPNTTPVLLSDSDFTLTNSGSFGIARYRVRENFQRAIEALKKVCGSPKTPEFYRNALRAYADGHVEVPIEEVLTDMTADERAWLDHMGYTYAVKFIDALPKIRI